MKRLPRSKWIRRPKKRIMVGTCSTPSLNVGLPIMNRQSQYSRSLDRQRPETLTKSVEDVNGNHGDPHVVTQEWDDYAHSEKMQGSPLVSTKPKSVQHGVDELKFYLETIQSGIKPEPVQLPKTSWPHGVEMPPSTVSSVASMQSNLESMMAAAQMHNDSKWMFSSENPAVVRIREQGDYTFDASAQDTESVNSDNVVRVTVDTTLHNSGHSHVEHHNTMSLDSRSHAFKNVFMPPEQNPVAERRKQERIESRRLLNQLRAQGHVVRSAFNQSFLNGKYSNGTIHVDDLKTKLTEIFCQNNNANNIGRMSKRDIDRLVFSLPNDQLDSEGRVHLARLLGTARHEKRARRSTGFVRLPNLAPESDNNGIMSHQITMANNRPYLDTGASFERVIVPDTRSALFAPASMTYTRGVTQSVPVEQMRDKQLREMKLKDVGQRQRERMSKLMERKSREEEELALKDSARLQSKQDTAARYSAFLEKETLRRKKMENKFALKLFLEDPPLRLDHRRHQYKQYIDDGTRDRQMAAYNQKLYKLSKSEWHRIFR